MSNGNNHQHDAEKRKRISVFSTHVLWISIFVDVLFRLNRTEAEIVQFYYDCGGEIRIRNHCYKISSSLVVLVLKHK